MSQLGIKILSVPLLLVVNGAAVALLVGFRVKRKVLIAIAAAGILGFVVRQLALVVAPSSFDQSFDFQVFQKIGATLLAGHDPYHPPQEYIQPNLYPPNSPPVLAFFAWPTAQVGYVVWLLLNLTTAIGLGLLAQRALADPHDPSICRIDPLEATVLGLSIALSPSVVVVFDVGQLALLIVGLILTSLVLRQVGRPGAAGLFFTLAAMKPTVAAPFLLLFIGRAYARFWTILVLGTALLVLITSQGLVRLPNQMLRLGHSLAQQSGPGGLNDIDCKNESHESIIGFDHALYRLGLQDRTLARLGQLILVVALGVPLGCLVTGGRLSWPAKCSLVAAGSLLFFYHRLHDLSILVLPMVYSAYRARVVPRSFRVPYVIAGVTCLGTLWLPGRVFKLLTPRSFEWGNLAGWSFRGILLPWATWGVLIIIATILFSELRSSQSEQQTQPMAEQPRPPQIR